MGKPMLYPLVALCPGFELRIAVHDVAGTIVLVERSTGSEHISERREWKLVCSANREQIRIVVEPS